MKPIDVKIVSYTESRNIRRILDPVTKKVSSLEAVPGSEKAVLMVELPTGALIKVRIPYKTFLVEVAPLIEDNKPGE